MPDQPMDQRQVLDHLGLGAGLCDALGRGEIIEQATHPHPAMRDLTVGAPSKPWCRHSALRFRYGGIFIGKTMPHDLPGVGAGAGALPSG